VTTPTRQVLAGSSTSITTFDSSGNIIDSAADVSTDAITEGLMTGPRRLMPLSSFVGGLYTTSFLLVTTSGSIPAGGFIEISIPLDFPQMHWHYSEPVEIRVAHNTDILVLSVPTTLKSSLGTTLNFAIPRSIPQLAYLNISLSQLAPPLKVQYTQTPSVTTFDSESNIIDSVSDVSIDPVICPLGHMLRGAQSFCFECPIGKFSNNGAAVNCTSCERGRYNSIDQATSCTGCDAGKYASSPSTVSCTNCTAGMFSVASSDSCSECPVGKFSAEQAEPACTDCPAGKYEPTDGDTSCTMCPGGRYQPQLG